MSAERIGPIQRAAARLVTGPLAFLLAGLIDLSVFSGQALRHAVGVRIAARRSHARHPAGGARIAARRSHAHHPAGGVSTI